jgi:hypothetical protein
LSPSTQPCTYSEPERAMMTEYYRNVGMCHLTGRKYLYMPQAVEECNNLACPNAYCDDTCMKVYGQNCKKFPRIILNNEMPH